MSTKRLYILSAIIVIAVLIICGIISLVGNIKVDDFRPAFIAFVIDSSENNTKIEAQKKFIKHFCATLDPDDRIKILQVSKDSYLIYEGSPQSLNEITKSLNCHVKVRNTKNGVAYDEAIKKSVQHCLVMKKDGYIPAVVVIGALENGEKDAIDWKTLPSNIEKTLKYMPDFSMAFLWAEPKRLDTVKVKLTPILGENRLIISTELTVDKVSRKILKAIGR